MKLSDLCIYGKEKIESSVINRDSYVSTDNLLPNFGGTINVNSFPVNQKINKYEKDDILLSNIRPYFKKMIIANSDGGCSTDVLVIKAKENVVAKFLFYKLMTKDFFDYVILTAKGTKMPRGDKDAIMNYKLDIPSIIIQKKIIKILDNINTKIILNNQINDNLQNIILSIFNKFLADNSNFNKTTIKDAVKKIGTGADAIQRAPIVEYDTGIRCIRVGDMTNLRTKYQWGFTKMTEKDFENYKLNVGDIIVTRTAVNGLSYLIEDNMKIVCNNGLIRMSVNSKYNPLYIYLYLQTKDFYNYVHRIDAETSVRPNMKVNFFTAYKIREIPIQKQNEICRKLLPLRKKQQSIIIENERLANLRDTLLPRLMSGEIDLDKVEI